MNKLKNFKKIFKTYFIITFGLLINSIGWTAFLLPAKIVGGGISGVSSLIFYASGFPVGISYLIINIFLVILGIKILGGNFGVKTIYSVIVLSVFYTFFQRIITEPIINEPFMATLLGGALAGAGVGMVFSQGGSTGGTDVFAMIINKYYNISPGKIILFFDVFIISSSFFIFHSLETIVYGFVTMVAVAYSIDLILSGSKQSVQVFVFSKHFEKIAEKISNKLNRGVTLVDGQGWYSKEDTKILLVMARKHESQNIIKIVKEIDPEGFISLGSVMGVYGRGFEEIRG
ncbi:MAG: YitT family protein [Bacteroidales bacterium]|nr:YitT family protein [Bacteroidales bacterium]